jgi:hypothetical protein
LELNELDLGNPPLKSSTAPRRRPGIGGIIAGVFLGVTIGIVGVIAYLKFTARGQPPELTDEQLQVAMEKWRRNGPPDYQMTVVVTSPESAAYTVTVHNGDVENLERSDGFSPRRHVWDSWSVAALLDIIRVECKEPDSVFQGQAKADIVQQVEFDLELGYPKRYRRIVLGSNSHVEWEITNFKTLPSAAP